MAKKTVINRAAKRYINSSTDEGLLQFAKESEQRQRKIVLDAEAEQNANKELLDFDANEIEDAQFEEVKSVDGFIDVTEVETSPANESESEEDPF
ncbi:TPA: Rect [Staphylococcus pseudintermedius]|nr:Rect [Staphylococcus pseudintermedius]